MKTGVLAINTGTPDAPTVGAVRAYLRQFLMDPAIIAAPDFIRKPLVNHIVKNRPERTVKHYEQFWTEEGSPFMLVSKQQVARLAAELQGRLSEDSEVVLAMRYGNPSIESGLRQLKADGCTRVVLLPLYPQNVNVCAGTCLKEAHRILDSLEGEGWNPDVVEIPSFHHRPEYRAALAASLRKHWDYKPGAKLLVSFHSTMLSDIKKDDTYVVQARQTARWLAEDAGIDPDDVILCFQSRFDSRKWLQPFTEDVLQELQVFGVTDVCIICPGFVADNIETMVEVDGDLRKKFIGHIPQNRERVIAEVAERLNFTYVPALGADSGLIKAMAAAICEKE